MDLPVEATVHVARFQDAMAVLRLLGSHGFQLTDLGGGQVRVRGYFQKLRAVKVRLEQLDQTQSRPAVSPGASSISKPDDGPASLSSSRRPPASWDSRTAAAPDQPGSEVVVVDPDVFRYAEHFKAKDMDVILRHHQVDMTTQDDDGSISITLRGRNSKMAVRDLQRLIHSLSQSLHTQEVPLKDARRHGAPLLDQMLKNHVSGPVLVYKTDDGLHLVGPSRESFELKQRLLGRSAHQSGRRTRSSSLPAANRSPGGGASADD